MTEHVQTQDGMEFVVEGELPEAKELLEKSGLPVLIRKDIRALKDYSKALSAHNVIGVSSGYRPKGRTLDIMELKDFLSKSGILVNRFVSSMDFRCV